MLKKVIRKLFKFVVLPLVIVYALFWAFSFKTYETEIGLSYSPEYARYLKLDSNKTYDAILTDLKPKTIRLAAPWSIVEPKDGQYDFSEIDHMVNEAKKINSRIVLVLGQKTPRWPECYIPKWAEAMNGDGRKNALLDYIKTVVERYKDNTAIEFWQAENEPYIKFQFGSCDAFNPDFTKDEVALIRALDPSRKVMITDSGEVSTWKEASQYGDILGTTVYRTVRTKSGMAFYYDWLPATFYEFRARLWGKDYNNYFISELQAEPWFAEGIPKTIEGFEKEETFNQKRFYENISYAQRTGASRIYLWGVEWWYFMKEKKGNSDYWEIAKKVLNS